MKIPLEKRLRKRAHVEIGRLQDELIEILYQLDGHFILHGGTSIWRCFSGLRFSEDIDLYAPSLSDDFEANLVSACKSRGLSVEKLKRTGNLLFGKIKSQEVEVRLEINYVKKASGAPLSYEKIDGSMLIVNSLSAGELIKEKISAYNSRRLIRDIYDIFFLCLKFPEEADWKAVRQFAGACEKPLDEGNLSAIVYSGAVPSFEHMLKRLGGRA